MSRPGFRAPTGKVGWMTEGVASAASATELGAEAVRLLQSLIRIDTVNPPGNERRAQLELLELLTDAGFECELLAAEPERANLVARLPGSRPGPTLAYLGHLDTVRADPDEWSHDPWSGELDGDLVWGRGAQDMKGQVAAEVTGAAELARGGWRPEAGELLLVLTADEETGGELGAKWLCEQHPDKVRADIVVNEGAGTVFEYGDRRLYTLCVGEKGIFRFKLRARGEAGHASLPRIGDNALIKLAPYVAKLRDQPPLEATPEGLEFLAALLGDAVPEHDLDRAVERIRATEPLVADYLAEPMLGVTLTPTRASASEKANVVPSLAEVLVDCRVPPGREEPHVRERIASVLGEGDYEIEFTEVVVGNRSPADAPLAGAIRDWVAGADPGAEVIPIVMPGFSDSHWFRRAFPDAIVYGFCPQRQMTLREATPLIHGADERLRVSDLELAARFFWDLPQRVLT
jgi:acetylornithine deacetylase/succinyl-diaminopimelate desuccinylase-like protein